MCPIAEPIIIPSYQRKRKVLTHVVSRQSFIQLFVLHVSMRRSVAWHLQEACSSGSTKTQRAQGSIMSEPAARLSMGRLS